MIFLLFSIVIIQGVAILLLIRRTDNLSCKVGYADKDITQCRMQVNYILANYQKKA